MGVLGLQHGACSQEPLCPALLCLPARAAQLCMQGRCWPCAAGPVAAWGCHAHARMHILSYAVMRTSQLGGRCPQPPQQLPLGPAGASVRAGHQAATSPRTCWGCAQTDLRPRVPQQPRPGTAGRTTQLRVVSGNHDVISGPPILACYSDEWCYGDGASSAAGTTTAVGARGRAIAWHCAQ